MVEHFNVEKNTGPELREKYEKEIGNTFDDNTSLSYALKKPDNLLEKNMAEYFKEENTGPESSVIDEYKILKTFDLEEEYSKEVNLVLKPAYIVLTTAAVKRLQIEPNKLSKISKAFGFGNETDKAEHIIASSAIYYAYRSIGKEIGDSMINTLTVGIFKELSDGIAGTGNLEVKDIAADALGILIAAAVDKILQQNGFSSDILNSNVKINFGHYNEKGEFNLGFDLTWTF